MDWSKTNGSTLSYGIYTLYVCDANIEKSANL